MALRRRRLREEKKRMMKREEEEEEGGEEEGGAGNEEEVGFTPMAGMPVVHVEEVAVTSGEEGEATEFSRHAGKAVSV